MPGTQAFQMIAKPIGPSCNLDFAQVDIPREMQGRSLRSIVKGQAEDDWRQAIYYHYYENEHGWHNVRGHYGIRTERYKLSYFFRDDNWELFDLELDPNEMNNVYADPAYTAVLKDLQHELKDIQQVYGDTDLS